jgi:hypothetical protein
MVQRGQRPSRRIGLDESLEEVETQTDRGTDRGTTELADSLFYIEEKSTEQMSKGTIGYLGWASRRGRRERGRQSGRDREKGKRQCRKRMRADCELGN